MLDIVGLLQADKGRVRCLGLKSIIQVVKAIM